MAQVEPGPAAHQEHQFGSPTERSSRRYSEQAPSKKQPYSTQRHHSGPHRGLQEQPAPYHLYNAQPSSKQEDDSHHGPTGQTPTQQRPQSEGNVQQATSKQQTYSNLGRPYSDQRYTKDQPAPYQGYSAQPSTQQGRDDHPGQTGQIPTQQRRQSEGNVQQATSKQQTYSNLGRPYSENRNIQAQPALHQRYSAQPSTQQGGDDRRGPIGQTPTQQGLQSEGNPQQALPRQQTLQNTYSDLQGGYHGYQIEPDGRPLYMEQEPMHYGHPTQALRHPDPIREPDVCQGFAGHPDVNQSYTEQPSLWSEHSRHAMSPLSFQRAPMAQRDRQQLPDTRPGQSYHRHSDRRSNRRQTFGNRESARPRLPGQVMYDYPQRREQVPPKAPRQSSIELQHLKNSKPEYPLVNKRAFLILSVVNAVCCSLILVSGVVVAASNKERRSFNGTAVGPVSIVYAILGGMSVVFGILNSRSATECKVITGLVFSILSSAGSVVPAAFGATNAVECLPAFSDLWHDGCPSYIFGLSLFLIILSFIVCVLTIVQASFSCRAMCCLPAKQVVGNVSMNNNLEERTTKM